MNKTSVGNLIKIRRAHQDSGNVSTVSKNIKIYPAHQLSESTSRIGEHIHRWAPKVKVRLRALYLSGPLRPISHRHRSNAQRPPTENRGEVGGVKGEEGAAFQAHSSSTPCEGGCLRGHAAACLLFLEENRTFGKHLACSPQNTDPGEGLARESTGRLPPPRLGITFDRK